MEEIIIAIFSAVIGALFGFIIQSYNSLRTQDIAHINDFISDLERIESLAVKYWSNNYKNNSNEQRMIASQLRGAFHASSVFLGVAQPLLASHWEKFSKLDGLLFDTATGGSFETKSQSIDPARIVEIMTHTNEIRCVLRNSRRNIYWFR